MASSRGWFSKRRWLKNYKNPLPNLLGEDFFKSIPQVPGVYYMFSEAGGLLYVGKAKNLKARLNSYKRAAPSKSPKKVLRLCKVIHKIEWDECASEKDALLKENEVLRTMKPPFNIVNTRPETYYFIVMKQAGLQLQFFLTTKPQNKSTVEDVCFYGAFKGRHRVRLSFISFLRLLWLSHANLEKLKLPIKLTRDKPVFQFSLALSANFNDCDIEDWIRDIKKFFLGESDNLLHRVTRALLLNNTLAPKYYSMIQEDIEQLTEFYLLGPRRNFTLRERAGIQADFIAQDEIDDLLVCLDIE